MDGMQNTNSSIRPARQNTKHPRNNMRHLVYNLEHAVACTDHRSNHKYEKIHIIIDYHGFKLGDAPPMRVSKHTVDLHQNHYPKRMYRAYICDPPLMFRYFWSMIRPFLDPKTKAKVVFCYGEEGRKILAKAFDLDTGESTTLSAIAEAASVDDIETSCKPLQRHMLTHMSPTFPSNQMVLLAGCNLGTG